MTHRHRYESTIVLAMKLGGVMQARCQVSAELCGLNYLLNAELNMT